MITLHKYINTLLKIAVGLSPTLIILSSFSFPSLAQITPNHSPKTTPTQQIKNLQLAQMIKFPSSANRGKPKRSGAGGRRGNSCFISQEDKQSLTAIMPTWENQGKTVKDTSNLYVFVPQNNTEAGEFVLIDEEGKNIYETNFTPPNQPGIVEVNIPASASLKVGKKYYWYFTLICDDNDRSKDEYVSGSLERTNIGSLLNSYIQQATPLKQAEIYARNNIWYDTIYNVASLRKNNPQLWVGLLESVGLKELANQPFVELGQPKP